MLISLQKKMDLWTDAWTLAEQSTWQPWIVPRPATPPPALRPTAIQRRESAGQATLARKKAQEPPPDPAKVITARELCALKDFQCDCLPIGFHIVVLREILSFTRAVLELEPSARDRALRKIRRLEQCFLCPVANLRPRSRSP